MSPGLRLKLLRARLRRRRLNRSAEPTSRELSFYLPPEKVPVEGIDFEPVEPSPDLAARVETTRAELVAVAARRAAPSPGSDRRRPRIDSRRLRTVVAAFGAILTLGILGACANAVILGTTGVDAVDRLLGIWEADPQRGSAGSGPADGGPDLSPESAGPTIEYEVAGPAGPVMARSTSYLGERDQICMVDSRVTDDPDRATVNCRPPGRVADALRTKPLLAFTLHVRRSVVLSGQLDGGVEDLAITGPVGPLDVHIGDPWNPGIAGLRTMRPFVALVTPESTTPDGRAREVDLALDISRYTIRTRSTGQAGTTSTPLTSVFP